MIILFNFDLRICFLELRLFGEETNGLPNEPFFQAL